MNEKIHLVCITYNQIQYINEAINSILNQDYNNLQIIISDDNSTDGTATEIQHILDNYKGPHLVKYIKNKEKKGLIQNLWGALKDIDQGLVILAAGDDISLPNRASCLYRHWIELKKPLAIGSSHFTINESGEVVNEVKFFNELRKIEFSYRIGEEFSFRGASMAFDITIIKKYSIPHHKNAVEDIVLSYRAAMNGSGFYIPETLVKYRAIENSLSNINNKTINSYLRGMLKTLNSRLDSAKSILDDISETEDLHKQTHIKRNINESIEKICIEISLHQFDITLAIVKSIKAGEINFFVKTLNKLIRDLAWIKKNKIKNH